MLLSINNKSDRVHLNSLEVFQCQKEIKKLPSHYDIDLRHFRISRKKNLKTEFDNQFSKAIVVEIKVFYYIFTLNKKPMECWSFPIDLKDEKLTKRCQSSDHYFSLLFSSIASLVIRPSIFNWCNLIEWRRRKNRRTPMIGVWVDFLRLIVTFFGDEIDRLTLCSQWLISLTIGGVTGKDGWVAMNNDCPPLGLAVQQSCHDMMPIIIRLPIDDVT